ncbi:uncharacterized protein LOC122667679 isoform X2 [Telopea speciosissima]|uniref:uncharacterized protein LOC122667679 isoform X2 n=1 Tax=Telopea speciosissima TaxID=54955 RepID=UPI001CC47A38|nr:uncharacterized protein LOC122667679 isoform X2 [Telopea speciosissima]
MEALRRLEEVQRMMTFMRSRGLSSDHPDSDRFLADLMLLLVSVAIVEEALLFTGEGIQQDNVEHHTQFRVENKIDLDSWAIDVEDMAVVGLDAMKRSNSSLDDFCRSYFMFHDLDVSKPQTIFIYLPILSFTESYIYQLDRYNEEILHPSTKGDIPSERGPDHFNNVYKMQDEKQRLRKKFLEVFKTDPFRPLILLLERQGLLTERIREELRCGQEYWALERNLCNALLSNKEVFIEDVMRGIDLKSFDYRVLNLLLYQLRGEQVNELHMEFLSISEFLVEISDDLFDYEDDVVENNFNILRMFVWIYGASVAPSMLAKCIAEAEEKYERLSKTLDPNLSLKYWRRCEEATKEGGNISGHSLGTWTIPPVIVDEELYRTDFPGFRSSVNPD